MIAFQLFSYTHRNKVGCVSVYGEKGGGGILESVFVLDLSRT